ncbi:hypothetical protein C6P40_003510 [Pichia californica]|uniref:K Homology domain-containing protein n=1 Tax=Pichia californica TaxID=460514 RepID=A0A9P6WQA2_9ASCO|nr:hypothetical protein C6P40_003510 [[Candida] californica]
MSTPAELLALKHEQAAVAADVEKESISSQSPTVESTLEDSLAATSASTEGSTFPTLADEITSGSTAPSSVDIPVEEPKKVIRMDDDNYFPSLGDAIDSSVPAISWGPSATGSSSSSSSSSWAKPSKSFKPAVKSSSTQVTFIIDDEQQQNLAKGELFKIFAKIQSSLNVKVESTYSGATKKRTFLLSGPSENVPQAKRELIRQLTKPTKISFDIPSKLRSTIIGSGGRTLKPIIEATSVKIDIGRESDNVKENDDDDLLTEDEELFGKSLTVTIEGDIQGCSDAKAKILAIVNENTKTLSVKVPVPEKIKPFVSNEFSKSNFGEGVEIITPEPTSKINFILISGPREAVIEARNSIKTTLVLLDNQVIVEEREVPKHLHPFLDADKILAQTNVFIETPSIDDASSKVKFIGSKSNISKAILFAKELTSEYFIDTLDISKSHGGNYQHAKNLTAFFLYTKYFDALGSQHGVKITGPSYKSLVDPEVKNVIISFSSTKDKKDDIKKARKELVENVNKITPNFIKSVTDVESFLFPKIDFSVAIENNVSIVPLGSLAGASNILLLISQQNDDEFLPSADQVEEKLNTVNKSLDKLRTLGQELATETIETDAEDQEHLEGSTLNVLLNKFEPNTIEIKLHQNADGPSANEIYLRGYKSEIKKAITDIKQLIDDIKNYEEASKYNTSIEFPTKYLARFIGQKGASLNQIKDEFNVKIDVLTEEDSKNENAEIKLTGLKSNVDECIKKIHQLNKKWADEKTVSLNIEPKYRKQLIGPSGIYVNRLQDKYNVKIQFSDSSDSKSGVVIKGPSRGVIKVEEEIKQLLDYEKENGFTETIQVPSEALSRVIGKNGETINDISADTGIRIHAKTDQLKAKESGSADFELVGSKAGIKEAKAKIDAIVKRIVNSTKETIEVDPKWYGNLIGPNGRTLREIITKAGGSEDDRDYRRFIQLPSRNSDSKEIVCEGDKTVVAKIIKHITELVNDLESVTDENITVPKKQHKIIVGTGGSVRRGIEEEFKVRIYVPKQDSESEDLRINGKPENIAKAVEKINALIASKK